MERGNSIISSTAQRWGRINHGVATHANPPVGTCQLHQYRQAGLHVSQTALSTAASSQHRWVRGLPISKTKSTHTMSRRFCTEVTPECPVEWTTYGYYPNLGGNVFLLVLFAICFFAQLVIGWKTKVRAFAIVVAIGCGLESIGYGGRLMMNKNPWTSDGFKMQVCCLILAPSFLAAGYYLTIKTVVNHLGRESSKLAPRWYTWIFIGCDIVSILTQAAGGGIASAATDGDNLLDVGNGLIMAGIAFQVATMATCMVITLDFFIRLRRNTRNNVASTGTPGALSDPKFKFYLACSAFGFLTIFIRCVYRYV